MLKNEYLVAKIGVDTAENEPLNVTHSAAGENTELVVSRLLRADLVHVLNTQLLACYQEENTLTHTMLNSIESYVFVPVPRDFTFYERKYTSTLFLIDT